MKLDYHFYYHLMADGTVKQVNPFTGVEVWAVPARGRRIFVDDLPDTADDIIEKRSPEDYCAFCESQYFSTAPEKARVVIRNNKFEVLHHISPSNYFDEYAAFRRVANLFEIVSVDYWKKNFNYKLSSKNAKWKEEYLDNPQGKNHVLKLLEFKLEHTNRANEFGTLSEAVRDEMSDAFFGGGHELVIAHPHYLPHATKVNELFATGDMTDEEHFNYFLFIIDAMADIVENNRYVRYISIYKNWLRSAGASFNHLHTQLVAIDEWGEAIDRQIKMIIEDKNVFNSLGPNFAGHHNLIFAENEFAVAFIGIGHRYPTIEIYSKSINARPHEHTPEEIRGMSDIVRACHAAIGRTTSINEEWYYTPFDSIFKMPWHINIKLRINVPAGFEGGTSIFINPLTPIALRDRIVPRLYDLRLAGRCNPNIRIAEECRVIPNPLLYYKNT